MTDQELDELEAKMDQLADYFRDIELKKERGPWIKPIRRAKNAIAELRKKNARLVAVLEGIAGAIERGTKATGERPHYLKGKDGGKIEGEEIDTICEGLLSIGRLARKALKENTQ